jgi:hypothetical protein
MKRPFLVTTYDGKKVRNFVVMADSVNEALTKLTPKQQIQVCQITEIN